VVERRACGPPARRAHRRKRPLFLPARVPQHDRGSVDGQLSGECQPASDRGPAATRLAGWFVLSYEPAGPLDAQCAATSRPRYSPASRGGWHCWRRDGDLHAPGDRSTGDDLPDDRPPAPWVTRHADVAVVPAARAREGPSPRGASSPRRSARRLRSCEPSWQRPSSCACLAGRAHLRGRRPRVAGRSTPRGASGVAAVLWTRRRWRRRA